MRALALALCAAVSGCGSLDVARYAVAEGKPAARLHIEYQDSVGAPAKVFVLTRPLEGDCRMRISDIAILATLGGSKNALINYEPAWTRDVVVAAGEPIVLSISSGTVSTTTRTSCGFRVKFEPEPNEDYELIYRTTAAQCFLRLYKRVAFPNGTTALASVPIVDPHPNCK